MFQANSFDFGAASGAHHSPQNDAHLQSITSNGPMGKNQKSEGSDNVTKEKDPNGAANGSPRTNPNIPHATVAQFIDIFEVHFGLRLGSSGSTSYQSTTQGGNNSHQVSQQPTQQHLTSPTAMDPLNAANRDIYGESSVFRDGLAKERNSYQHQYSHIASTFPVSGSSASGGLPYQPRLSTPNTAEASPNSKTVNGFPIVVGADGANIMRSSTAIASSRNTAVINALATMRPSRFLQQAHRAPLRLSKELQAKKDAGLLLSSNLRAYSINPDSVPFGTYNVHTVSIPRHYAENCLPHIFSGISSSLLEGARGESDGPGSTLVAPMTSSDPSPAAANLGGTYANNHGATMGLGAGSAMWMSHMMDSSHTTQTERLNEAILFSLRRITHFHFQTLLMGYAALLPLDNDFGLSPSRLALSCGGEECVRNLVHGPHEHCDVIPYMAASDYSNISARVMPLLKSSLPATVNAGLAAFKAFVDLSNQSTATESTSVTTTLQSTATRSVSSGLMLVRDATSYHNLLIQLFPTLLRFEAYEVLLRLIAICATWRFAEQGTRAAFLFRFIRACLPSDYAPLVELALRSWRTVYDACVKVDGVCPAIRDVELRDKAVEWLLLDSPPSHVALAKNGGKTISSLLIFRHLMAVAPQDFLGAMIAIQPKSSTFAAKALNTKTLLALVDAGKALLADKDALDDDYDFTSIANVSNHFFFIIWNALKDTRNPRIRDLAAETLQRALLLLVSEVTEVSGLPIVLEAVLMPLIAQAIGLLEGRVVPILAVGPLGPVIESIHLAHTTHNDNSGEESDSDTEDRNSPMIRNSTASRRSGYGSGSSQSSRSNRSSRASSFAAKSSATRATNANNNLAYNGSIGWKIPITDATFHAGTLVLGAVIAAYKLMSQRVATHASAGSNPAHNNPEYSVISPHVLPSVLSGNPSILAHGPHVSHLTAALGGVGGDDVTNNNESTMAISASHYAPNYRFRPMTSSHLTDGTAPPSLLNTSVSYPTLQITVPEGHYNTEIVTSASPSKSTLGHLFSDAQMRAILNAILAHNQKLASQTRLSGIRLLPLLVGVQTQFFAERLPPENFCLEALLTATVRNLELATSATQRYHYLTAAAVIYTLHPHHANPKLFALTANDKLISYMFRLLIGKGRLDVALLPVCWFVESADPTSKSFLTRHILAQLNNLFADSPLTPEFAAGLQRLCIAEPTILTSVQNKLVERIKDELKVKDVPNGDRSGFAEVGLELPQRQKGGQADGESGTIIKPSSPTFHPQGKGGSAASMNINQIVSAVKTGWTETATTIETKLNCFRILQYLKVQWLGSSNFFTSFCLPYFNHPSPLLRLECVKSCLKVVFSEGTYGVTNPRILGLLTAHLATTALTDTSEEIRYTALTTLTDARMSGNLYQSQQVIDILFAIINDESARVANLSIAMLRDLSFLNPSATLPRLRRVLLQTLTEIQHAASHENASKDISDALLQKAMNMMEAAPVATAFYLRFVIRVLNSVLLQIDVISPQSATVAMKMLIFAFNLAAEDDWPIFLPFVDIILTFMEQTEKDLIRFPERFVQFKRFLLPALNALSCVTQASSGSEPVFDRIVPILHRLLLFRSSNADRELTMAVMKMVGAISSLDPQQTDLLALTENNSTSKNMAKLTTEKSIFNPRVEAVPHEVMHLLLQKLNTEHSSTEVYAFAFEALATTISMPEIKLHRQSYFPSLATVLSAAMMRSFTLRDRAFAFLVRACPKVLDSPHPRDVRVLFALCRKHWNPNEPLIISRITRLIQILIVKMPTGLHDYKAWFTTSILHIVTQYCTMPELREATLNCLNLLKSFHVNQKQDSMLFVVIPSLCHVIQIATTTDVRCATTQLLTQIVARMTTAQLDSYIPRIVDTCVASLTSTVGQRKKALAIIATAEAVELGSERILSRTAAETQQSLFYQREWAAIQQQAKHNKSGGGFFNRLLGKEKPALPAADNILALKHAIEVRRHNVYRNNSKQEIRDILQEYKDAKAAIGSSRLCLMGLPASAAARITWVSRSEFEILALICAVATSSCRQLYTEPTSVSRSGNVHKGERVNQHHDHVMLKSNGVFDAFFATIVSAIKKRFCHTKDNPFGPTFIAQVIASRARNIAAVTTEDTKSSEKSSIFGGKNKDKKSDTASHKGRATDYAPSVIADLSYQDGILGEGETPSSVAITPFDGHPSGVELTQEALHMSALEQSPAAIQFSQPEISSQIIELLTKCKSCTNEQRMDGGARILHPNVSTTESKANTSIDGYDVGDAVMIDVVRPSRNNNNSNAFSQRSNENSALRHYQVSPISTVGNNINSNSNSNPALQTVPNSSVIKGVPATGNTTKGVTIKTRSEKFAEMAAKAPRSAPISLPQRSIVGAAGSITHYNGSIRGKDANNASVVFRRRSVSTGAMLPPHSSFYPTTGSVLTANVSGAALSASFGVVSAVTPLSHQFQPDAQSEHNTALQPLLEGYNKGRVRAMSASARYTNNGSLIIAHPTNSGPSVTDGSFAALPPPSAVACSFEAAATGSNENNIHSSFAEMAGSISNAHPSLPPRPTAVRGGATSTAAFSQKDPSYFGHLDSRVSLSGVGGGASRTVLTAYYQEAQTALKIWRSSEKNKSEEDWRQWIAGIALPLLKASPIECLRACYPLAEIDFSILCALFPALQLTMLHHINKSVAPTAAATHISEWCDEFTKFGQLVARHLEFDVASQQVTTPSTNPYNPHFSTTFGESLSGGVGISTTNYGGSTFPNTAANSKSYANSCYASVQQSPVLAARPSGGLGAPPIMSFSVPATNTSLAKRHSDMLPNFTPQQSPAVPATYTNVGSVSVSGGLGGRPSPPSGAITATTSARTGPLAGSVLMSPFFSFAPAPAFSDGLTAFPPAMTVGATVPPVNYYPSSHLMGSINDPLGAVMEESQSNSHSSYPSRQTLPLGSGQGLAQVHHFHLPYDILAEIARSAHYIQCNTEILGPNAHAVSKSIVANLARGALLVPVAIYHLEQLIAEGDSHHAPALVEMYKQALLHDDGNNLKYVLDTMEQATHMNDAQGPRWLESVGRTEEAISAYVSKLAAANKLISPRPPQSPTKAFGNTAELAGSLGSGFGFGHPAFATSVFGAESSMTANNASRPPLPTRPNRGSISGSNPVIPNDQQQASMVTANMLSVSDAVALSSIHNSPILSRTDSEEKNARGSATGPASFLRLPPAGNPSSPVAQEVGVQKMTPYNNEIVIDGWTDKDVVLGLSRCYNSLMDFSSVLKLYRLARYHNTLASAVSHTTSGPKVGTLYPGASQFDDISSTTPPGRDLNPLSDSTTISPLLGAKSVLDPATGRHNESSSTNVYSQQGPSSPSLMRVPSQLKIRPSRLFSIDAGGPTTEGSENQMAQSVSNLGRSLTNRSTLGVPRDTQKRFSMVSFSGKPIAATRVSSSASQQILAANTNSSRINQTVNSSSGVVQRTLNSTLASQAAFAAVCLAQWDDVKEISRSVLLHKHQNSTTGARKGQTVSRVASSQMGRYSETDSSTFHRADTVHTQASTNRETTSADEDNELLLKEFAATEIDDIHLFFGTAASFVSAGNLGFASRLLQLVNDHLLDRIVLFRAQSEYQRLSLNSMFQRLFELSEGLQFLKVSPSSALRVNSVGQRMLPPQAPHRDVVSWVSYRSVLLPIHRQLVNVVSLTNRLLLDGYNERAVVGLSALSHFHPESPTLFTEAYRATISSLHDAPSLRSLSATLSETTNFTFDLVNVLADPQCGDEDAKTLVTGGVTSELVEEYPLLDSAVMLKIMSIVNGKLVPTVASATTYGGAPSHKTTTSFIVPASVSLPSQRNNANSFSRPVATNVAGLIRAELTLLKVSCLDKLQSVETSETLRARLETHLKRQHLASTYTHSKTIAGVRASVLPPIASDEAVMIRYRLAESAVETYMHSPPMFHELAMRLFDILEYIEDEIRLDPSAGEDEVDDQKENEASTSDEDLSEFQRIGLGKSRNTKLRDMATQVVGALSKVIRFGTANYLSHPYFTNYTGVNTPSTAGKKMDAFNTSPLAALKQCEDAQKDALFLQYIRDFSGNRRVVCAQKITQLNHALLKMVHVSVSILGNYKVFDFSNAPIHLWCAAGPVWVNMGVQNPKILERLRIMCVQSIPFLRFMIYHLVSYFDKKPKPASPLAVKNNGQGVDDVSISATSSPQHTFSPYGKSSQYYANEKRASTSTTTTTQTNTFISGCNTNDHAPITRTYTTNPQGTIYPRNIPSQTRGNSTENDTAPNTSASPDLRPPTRSEDKGDSEKYFTYGGKSDPFPISPSSQHSLNDNPAVQSLRPPGEGALSSYLSGTFTNMSDQHFTGSRPGSLPRSLPVIKAPSQIRRAVSNSTLVTNTASNNKLVADKTFLKPPIPNTRSLNSLGTSPSVSGTYVDDGTGLGADAAEAEENAMGQSTRAEQNDIALGEDVPLMTASHAPSSSVNAIQVQCINEVDREALLAVLATAPLDSTRSEHANSSDTSGPFSKTPLDQPEPKQLVVGEDKIMTVPLPSRSELSKRAKVTRSRSVDAALVDLSSPIGFGSQTLNLRNYNWMSSPPPAEKPKSTTSSPQEALSNTISVMVDAGAVVPSPSSDEDDYVSVSDSEEEALHNRAPLTRRNTAFIHKETDETISNNNQGPLVTNNSFSFQPMRISRQPSPQFDMSPSQSHSRVTPVHASRTRSGFHVNPIATNIGSSPSHHAAADISMGATSQSATTVYPAKPAPPRRLHRFLAAIAHASKAHRHIVHDVLTMGRFVISNGPSVTLKDSRCPAPQSLSQLSMAVVSGDISNAYALHEDRNAGRPSTNTNDHNGGLGSSTSPAADGVDLPDDLGVVLTQDELPKERQNGIGSLHSEDHRSELSKVVTDSGAQQHHPAQHHHHHTKRLPHAPHSFGTPNVLQVTRRTISNDGLAEVLPSMCNKEEQLIRMFLSDGTAITFMMNLREEAAPLPLPSLRDLQSTQSSNSLNGYSRNISATAQSVYLDNLRKYNDNGDALAALNASVTNHTSIPPNTSASYTNVFGTTLESDFISANTPKQKTNSSLQSAMTVNTMTISPVTPQKDASPTKKSNNSSTLNTTSAALKSQTSEALIQTLFGGSDLVAVRGIRTIRAEGNRRGSSHRGSPSTVIPTSHANNGDDTPVSFQLSQRTTSNASGRQNVRRLSSSNSGQSHLSRQNTPAKKRGSVGTNGTNTHTSGAVQFKNASTKLKLTTLGDEACICESRDLRQRLGSVSALRESIFNVLIQSMPLMHTRRAMRVPISSTVILLQCHVDPMRRFPAKNSFPSPNGGMQSVATSRGISVPPSLYHIVAAHHETTNTSTSTSVLNQSLFITRVALQLLRVHRPKKVAPSAENLKGALGPQGIERLASGGSNDSSFPLGGGVQHHFMGGGGVAYANSQRTRSFNRTPSGGEVSGEHYNSIIIGVNGGYGSPAHTFAPVPVTSVPNSPGALGALSPSARSRPHSPLRRERRTVIHNGNAVPTNLFDAVGSGLTSGNLTPTSPALGLPPQEKEGAQSTMNFDSSISMSSPAGPLGSIATHAYMMSSTGAGRVSSTVYVPHSDTSSANAPPLSLVKGGSTTMRPMPSATHSADTGDATINTAIESTASDNFEMKSPISGPKNDQQSLSTLGIGVTQGSSSSSPPQHPTIQIQHSEGRRYQAPSSQAPASASASLSKQQQPSNPEQWVSAFDQFATASQKFLNTYAMKISNYTEQLADVEKINASIASNRYESAFYTGGGGGGPKDNSSAADIDEEKTIPFGYNSNVGNGSWPYGAPDYNGGKGLQTDEELARIAKAHPNLRLLSKRTVLSDSQPQTHLGGSGTAAGELVSDPTSTRKGSEENQTSSFASEGMLGGTHNSIASPSRTQQQSAGGAKRPSESSSTGLPTNNSVSGFYFFSALGGQLSSIIEGVVAVTDSDEDADDENVIDFTLREKRSDTSSQPRFATNSDSPFMIERTATRKPAKLESSTDQRRSTPFTPLDSDIKVDQATPSPSDIVEENKNGGIKRRQSSGTTQQSSPHTDCTPPKIHIEDGTLLNNEVEGMNEVETQGVAMPPLSTTTAVPSPTTSKSPHTPLDNSVVLTKQYQEIIRVYQQLVKLERLTAVEREKSMTNSTNALHQKFLADAGTFADWLSARANYAQQLAEWSILQYLFDVDIGSRDPSRIVVDTATGNISHLDFGTFAMLPSPEDCFCFLPPLSSSSSHHGIGMNSVAATSFMGDSSLLFSCSQVAANFQSLGMSSVLHQRRSSEKHSRTTESSLEATPERLDATVRFSSARDMLDAAAETSPSRTSATAEDTSEAYTTKKVISTANSPRGLGPTDLPSGDEGALSHVVFQDPLVGYKLNKSLRTMMLPSLPAAHVGVDRSPIPFRLTTLLTNALPLRSPFGAFATHAAALLNATWSMAADIEGIAQYGLAPMAKATVLYQQCEVPIASPIIRPSSQGYQRTNSVNFFNEVSSTTIGGMESVSTGAAAAAAMMSNVSADKSRAENLNSNNNNSPAQKVDNRRPPSSEGTVPSPNAAVASPNSPISLPPIRSRNGKGFNESLRSTTAGPPPEFDYNKDAADDEDDDQDDSTDLSDNNVTAKPPPDEELMSATTCIANYAAEAGRLTSPLRSSIQLGHVSNIASCKYHLAPLELGNSSVIAGQSVSTFGLLSPDRQSALDVDKLPTAGIGLAPPIVVPIGPSSATLMGSRQSTNIIQHTAPYRSGAAKTTIVVIPIPVKMKFFDITSFALKLRISLPLEQRGNLPYTFVAPEGGNKVPISPIGSLSSPASGSAPHASAAQVGGSESSTMCPPSPAVAASQSEKLYEAQRHVLDAVHKNPSSGKKRSFSDVGSTDQLVPPSIDNNVGPATRTSSLPPTPPSTNSNAAQAFLEACNLFGSPGLAESATHEPLALATSNLSTVEAPLPLQPYPRIGHTSSDSTVPPKPQTAQQLVRLLLEAATNPHLIAIADWGPEPSRGCSSDWWSSWAPHW